MDQECKGLERITSILSLVGTTWKNKSGLTYQGRVVVGFNYEGKLKTKGPTFPFPLLKT